MKGEETEADRALAQGLTAVKVPLNILFHFLSQVQTLSHVFFFAFRTNNSRQSYSFLKRSDVCNKESVIFQTVTLVHKHSFILKLMCPITVFVWAWVCVNVRAHPRLDVSR